MTSAGSRALLSCLLLFMVISAGPARATKPVAVWGGNGDGTSGGSPQFQTVVRAGDAALAVTVRYSCAGGNCARLGPGFIKYDRYGRVTWSGGVDWPDRVAQDYRFSDAVTDSAGNIYLAGYSLSSPYQFLAAKFNPAGTEAWTWALDSGNSSDGAFAITLAADGNVVVGGQYAGDGYLVKISASTGLPAPGPVASGNAVVGLATAADGRIFVSRAASNGTGNVGALECYKTNLTTEWSLSRTPAGGRVRIAPDGGVWVLGNSRFFDFRGNATIARFHPVSATPWIDGHVAWPVSDPDGISYYGETTYADLGFAADGSPVIGFYTGSSESDGSFDNISGLVKVAAAGPRFFQSSFASWYFSSSWAVRDLAPYAESGSYRVDGLAVLPGDTVVLAGAVAANTDPGNYHPAYGVIALADTAALNPPAKAGSIEIRRNAIRVDRSEVAVIVVRGKPGGAVDLHLAGPSGLILKKIAHVTLDSGGLGTATFDGKDYGARMQTGLYYIIANGDFKDRKPLAIINKGGS